MRPASTDPEVWRVVPSVPGYLASSWGRIMKVPYLAPLPNGGRRNYGGQPTYGVWAKAERRFVTNIDGVNYKVHRMVCEAFHGLAPFEGAVVMHIDEDSRNNRPENLRWGTQRENLNFPLCRKRLSAGRKGRPVQKVTPEQAGEIVRRYASGERQTALASEYGLAPCTVSNIVNGRRMRVAA